MTIFSTQVIIAALSFIVFDIILERSESIKNGMRIVLTAIIIIIILISI